MIGQGFHPRVAFGSNHDHAAAARFSLLDLADHLLVPRIVRGDGQHGHVPVNQRDWTVLHFAGRVSFCMDIRNFFQLQRAFIGNRHVRSAPKIQHIADVFHLTRHLHNFRFAIQAAPYQIRHQPQVSHQLLALFLFQRPAQVAQQHCQQIQIHQRSREGFG